MLKSAVNNMHLCRVFTPSQVQYYLTFSDRQEAVFSRALSFSTLEGALFEAPLYVDIL